MDVSRTITGHLLAVREMAVVAFLLHHMTHHGMASRRSGERRGGFHVHLRRMHREF